MFEWIKHLPKTIGIVGSLIPFIQLLVRTAETPGFGPEKKEAVLKGVTDFLAKEDVPKAIAKLTIDVSSIVIDIYVFVCNTIGFFKGTKEDEE